MKKFIITISIGILVAGCANLTPEQRSTWSQCIQDINENLQRQMDRKAYGQPQIQVLQPVNPVGGYNQSTYWQERYYEDKYWDEIWHR